jgi:hypothetical protein
MGKGGIEEQRWYTFNRCRQVRQFLLAQAPVLSGGNQHLALIMRWSAAYNHRWLPGIRSC